MGVRPPPHLLHLSKRRAPARTYAETEPVTATAGMPITDAIKLLEARGEPRLIVLADDGETLAGLLCANETGTGFCVRP